MVKQIKKKCMFCDRLVCKLLRHVRTCKARKQMKAPIEEHLARASIKEMRQAQEITQLKNKISDLEDIIRNFRNSIGCKCFENEEDNMTIHEAVQAAIVKESTRRDYATTGKQYSTFCIDNSISEMSIKSAYLFLKHLHGQVADSTLRKRRRHLHSLMKIAQPHKQFILQPINKTGESEKVEKYVLEEDEIRELIEEAIMRKRKDLAALIKLLSTHALRINSACGIKGEDLKENVISVLDTKVSKRIRINLNPGLLQDLKYIAKSNGNAEDYIFFPRYKGRNRVISCTAAFNAYLKTSSLYPDEEIRFSSHMFRVTKANLMFREGEAKVYDEIKQELGHSSVKTTRHYVYTDKSAIKTPIGPVN